MTIIYRSPDIAIDAHVWHVVVNQSIRSGRLSTCYRFRQSHKEAWRPLTSWPGRLPKGLRRFFQPYRKSIEVTYRGKACF